MNIQREVRLRDLNRCQKCFRGESEGALLVFDHIIPWMVTQDNSPSNLQLLCRGCNADKGARLPGETAEQERQRVLAHNRRIMSTPEFKAYMEPKNEYVRALVKTDEYKAKHRAGMAAIDRAKWRERTMAACWGNPEVRARMSLMAKIKNRPKTCLSRSREAYEAELRVQQRHCRDYENSWSRPRFALSGPVKEATQ